MWGFNSYPEDWRTALVGAYIVYHPGTGRAYAGCTLNLYRRQREHLSDLKLGRHRNWPLQEAYNTSPVVEFFAIQTPTSMEAKKIEQEFITRHYGSGLLFNLSPDAFVAFKGLTHTLEAREKISVSKLGQGVGVPKSLEHRTKIGLANKGRSGPSPETTAKIVATRSRPVSIDGNVYSSLSDAAKEFGVTKATVYDRVQSNSEKFKTWKYV